MLGVQALQPGGVALASPTLRRPLRQLSVIGGVPAPADLVLPRLEEMPGAEPPQGFQHPVAPGLVADREQGLVEELAHQLKHVLGRRVLAGADGLRSVDVERAREH